MGPDAAVYLCLSALPDTALLFQAARAQATIGVEDKISRTTFAAETEYLFGES